MDEKACCCKPTDYYCNIIKFQSIEYFFGLSFELFPKTYIYETKQAEKLKSREMKEGWL